MVEFENAKYWTHLRASITNILQKWYKRLTRNCKAKRPLVSNDYLTVFYHINSPLVDGRKLATLNVNNRFTRRRFMHMKVMDQEK